MTHVEAEHRLLITLINFTVHANALNVITTTAAHKPLYRRLVSVEPPNSTRDSLRWKERVTYLKGGGTDSGEDCGYSSSTTKRMLLHKPRPLNSRTRVTDDALYSL